MTARSRKGEPQARVGVALLARQIADELFGAKGVVLYVCNSDDDHLGEWSRPHVVDRIQMALMRGRYKR